MEIRPVSSWRQVLDLRNLRNDCREFMTGDQHEITVPEQTLWWAGFKGSAYLGYMRLEPIAFGVIREDRQQRRVITGGVRSDRRNQGHGRELFEYLTREVAKPAHLEVLAENSSALDLYRKLGWRYCGTRDSPYGRVLDMTHD